MSDEALQFETLTLRRMPGFPRGGFALPALSPGVNIVFGPNASGKTTTAMALHELVWPGATGLPHVSLVGRYRIGDAAWHVDLDAGRARHQRDGADATAPLLPPANTRDRYNLALHDLLVSDSGDLAQAIARETAGGYDVGKAADALGFKSRPSYPRQKTKDVERAQQALRAARTEQEQLQDEEARLSALHDQWAAARDAQQQSAVVQLALDRARAQQSATEAATALEPFPAQLAKMTGDEAVTVRKLRERRDTLEHNRATAAQQMRDSEDELAACKLPEGPVPEQLIRTLGARVDDLREHEQQRDQLAAQLAGAREARQRERGTLGDAVDDDKLAGLDAVAFDELSQFAAQAERLHAARAADSEMQRWLGTPPSVGDDDLQKLQEGRQHLQSWLRASVTRPGTVRGTARHVLVGTAGVLAGVAIVLGITLHWSGLLLLLPAATIAAVIWWPRSTGGAQAHYREEYAALGLEAPTSWNEVGVNERIRDIGREIASAEIERERLKRWQDLDKQRVALSRDEQAVQEQRAEIAARLGVAPDTDERKLYWLANAISRWQLQQQQVVALEQALATTGAQCAELLDTINAELSPYGYEAATDRATAAGAVRELDGRRQRHADAARARAAAQKEVKRLGDEIERLDGEVATLLERLTLSTDELATLDNWCSQLGAYRAAVERRTGADGAARAADARLRQHPQFDASLTAMTVDALELALADAQREAAQADALQREITEIETRVTDAKAGHSVADAISALEAARDALGVERDADEAAVAGDALAQFIQEQTRQQQRPAVLQRAGEHFARITRGTYELEVDLANDDGPAFRAIDTVERIGRSLDELSSGTRVQLLLAVRMAFVEEQEAGVRLPLILDEVLANSDDERAAAIISAMLAIAADGRQVFYFTAQPDEVGKWEALLKEHDAIPHATVDLAAVRQLDAPERLAIERPASVAVPPPESDDYEAYGEALGVPGIDPYADVGAVHVWYLLEDATQLHRLLSLGVREWGPLRVLLAAGGVAGVDNPERVRARAEAAAEVIEQVCETWRAGHGKPIDRASLVASDAVSERFIDAVDTLATERDNDAARLLDALRDGEVKGFRTKAIEKLESYCEEAGHLAAGVSVTPETLRLKALAAARRSMKRGLLTETDVERLVSGVGMPGGAEVPG